MTPLRSGKLHIETKTGSASVELMWLGVSDARDPGAVITPFLDSVERELRQRRVVLDFRSLEYMNSSTVHPIISFVKKAAASGHEVHLKYDSGKSWQRLSFGALKAVTCTLKNVRVEG